MKIIANLDRRFAPAGITSERFLRVQVIAPESDVESRLPLNLALVIDRSGAMSCSLGCGISAVIVSTETSTCFCVQYASVGR